MTLPYRPREYVEDPAFTPLPFGLLTTLASEIRTTGDIHWEGGVTYETLCAESTTTYHECLVVSGTGDVPPEPPEPPVAKSTTAALQTYGAVPFTVYAEVDCSAPGFWDRADELTRDALTQSEQRSVEAAIWTGTSNSAAIVHPHLSGTINLTDASGATLDTTTQIVSGGVIVNALGNLEQALAECYDGIGVIHVPRSLATELSNANAITREGNQYVTVNGNVVVLGSGYPGTGPTGQTGNTWMYATSWPLIYRGELRMFKARDSFDRADNTVHMIAERTYVISWSCCQFAVKVTTQTEAGVQ